VTKRKGRTETKQQAPATSRPPLIGPAGRRTFRPETLPGFPLEYVADPSKHVAVRMYADELAFRQRLCAVLEATLARLVKEVSEGLLAPSTSAALGRAIGETVERIERMQTRIGELGDGQSAGQTEVLLARLNRASAQLRELRAKRRVRVPDYEVETTTSGGSDDPETPRDRNPLQDNDRELT